MDEREGGAKERTPILKLFYVKLSAGIKGGKSTRYSQVVSLPSAVWS